MSRPGQNVDVKITATDLTRQAFDSVQRALVALERESNKVGGKTGGGGIGGAFGSALGQVTKFAAGLGLAQMGLNAVSNAFAFVKNAALGMNASLETTTLQFTTLMGDADKARTLVKDLFEFAKKTPFETGPIIEASRMLQTFGGEALNTKETLTLLGDASAAVGSPINELGFWTGRLYAQLQAGKPFGEAAMRLTELAVLSPQARNQMEALQKSGASANEIYKTFTDSLGRFNGAMEKQAGTWGGVMSTFSDTINILLADILQPFFEFLRDGMAEVNAILGDDGVSAAFDQVKQAIGEAFGGESRDGVKYFAAAVIGGFQAIVFAADVVITAWNGLKTAFSAVAFAIVGALELIAKGLSKAIDAHVAIPGIGRAFKDMAENIRPLGGQLEGLRKSFGESTVSSFNAAAGYTGTSASLRNLNSALTDATLKLFENKGASDGAGAAASGAAKGQGAFNAALGAGSKEADAFQKKLTELAKNLTLAEKNNASLTTIVQEYGSAIKDAQNRSELFGQKLPEVVQRAVDRIKAAKLAETLKEAAGMTADVENGVSGFAKYFTKLPDIAEQGRNRVIAITAEMKTLMAKDLDEFFGIKPKEFGWVDPKTYEPPKNAIADFGSVLRELSQTFANLGQAGGPLDGVLGKIAELIQLMTLGQQAGTALRDVFFRTWQTDAQGNRTLVAGSQFSLDAFRNSQGRVTTGSAIAGGAAAFSAGASAYGSLMQATDVAGRGNRAGRGALTGAQIGGSIVPGYGHAIGAAVGAIWGAARNPGWEDVMNRVGRDYGAKITESLGRKIEEDAKKLFKKDRFTAEVYNYGNILQEAGGLNEQNVGRFASKLRDVFSLFEQGKLTAQQSRQVINENFETLAAQMTSTAGLVDSRITEMIGLDKNLKLGSESIKNFVIEQSQGALSGIERLLQSGVNFVDDPRFSGSLGASLAAAFQNLRDSGAPLAESLATVEPLVEALEARFSALGTDGGAAFATIREQLAYAKDEIAGPATQAVSGLVDIMRGLSNTGDITAEMYANLSLQIGNMLGGLDAQGKGGKRMLEANRDSLQLLYELQQRYGYELDEQTQKYLDQARAAGLVGEQNMAWQERLVSGMERVVDAIERVFTDRLPAAVEQGGRAIDDVLARIPRNLDINVDYRYNNPPDTGGSPGEGYPGYATGGLVMQRQLAWVGEREPELIGPVHFMRRALAGALQDLGHHSGPRIVQLVCDGRELAEIVLDHHHHALHARGL